MRKLLITFMIVQAYGNPLVMRNITSADSMPSIVMGGANCVCKFGGSGAASREDYQHSPGIGYHKLQTRATNWNEARKICIDEGAHLAIINSAAEALILREMLATETTIKGAANKDWAYLGIHDFYKEGDWTTIFGESLARTGYDHWVINEPNNGGNNENCGGLGKVGGLVDLNCNQAYAFFCEIPIAR